MVGNEIHLVFLSQLFPDGGELFTMSAPGRVELNQDILCRVLGNLGGKK